MTVMPTPDFGPREGPGLTPRRLLPRHQPSPPPTSKPDRAAADPDVAANGTVAAPPPWLELGGVTNFMAFLLAYGACANAQSQGPLLRRGSWT